MPAIGRTNLQLQRPAALNSQLRSGRNVMIIVIAASHSTLENDAMKTSIRAMKSQEFFDIASNVGFITALALFILSQISASAASDKSFDAAGSLKPLSPIPVAGGRDFSDQQNRKVTL